MEILPTPVELEVPGTSGMLRLARLSASGVATACGLPPDEAEDFTLLTDEICGTLIAAGAGSRLRVEFRIDDGALTVEGSTQVRPHWEPDAAQPTLSQQLLDVLADTHHLARHGNRLTLAATVPRHPHRAPAF